MWVGGRAYGYIRFKKSVPTENPGGGAAAAICIGSDPALTLLLLSIIATAANKKPVLFRWPSVLAVAARAVRLLGVCFAWVNRRAYWNISPVVALPPCPYKF